MPGTKEGDLQVLVAQPRERPLQREIVGDDPRALAVTNFGMGDAQVIGKMSRDPGDDHVPARELCRCRFDEPAPPVLIGGDDDEADEHDADDQEPAEGPRQNLEGASHQKT